MNHTPGPWHVDNADDFDRMHGPLHLSRVVFSAPQPGDDMPNLVAYVDTDVDARLLSAAPDLLAACKRLLSANVMEWPPEHHLRAMVEARNAIEKAEGGSHAKPQ